MKLFQQFTAILLFVGVSAVSAQELEPRKYTNLPVGVNFVGAGYAYTAGGILFDPTIPLDNANIKISGPVLAYVRSIKIGGMSGRVNMVLPYAWLSGSADYEGQRVSRDVSGLGDPRLGLTVNFIGAPALSLSEYRSYSQDLIFGASFQVYMPLSQYDPEKLVNIGTNRFTFKPELGISKAFGRFSLELITGISFFTINNDFYGGKTRSQSPVTSLQGHAVYSFKGGIWTAFDATFYWGGRTTVDGVSGQDLQQNSRFGLTLALPVSMRHTIKIYESSGVLRGNGTDVYVIGGRWECRWVKGCGK